MSSIHKFLPPFVDIKNPKVTFATKPANPGAQSNCNYDERLSIWFKVHFGQGRSACLKDGVAKLKAATMRET